MSIKFVKKFFLIPLIVIVLVFCLGSVTYKQVEIDIQQTQGVSIFNVKENNQELSSITMDENSMISLEKNYLSVQIANQIYEIIYNSSIMFSTISDNNYSGIFIDDNDELVVAGLADTKTEFISSSPALNELDFKYESMRYSFSELINVKEQIEAIHSQSVLGIDLIQRDNLLQIYVVDGSINKVKNEIRENNIYYEEEMFNFIEKEPIDKPLKKIKAGSKISKKSKILWWWKEDWYGTMGFSATHNSTGQKGIVTNQHVTPLGIEMRDVNNNVIGSSTVAVLSNTVDASFIPYSNQSEWEPTSYVLSSDPALYIGRVSNAYEGAKIWSVGATTGHTYGTVISINSSVKLEYDSIPRIMTDLIKHNSGIKPGDSGGPLISWTDRRAEQGIYGLNFAGNLKTNDGYAIKIANILDSLNVSVNFTK